MKKLVAIVLAVALVAGLGGTALAANFQEVGHGALSGPHYNLNIVGVPEGKIKTAEMKYTKGHTIFVSLKGRSKINLCQSGIEDGCLPDGVFQVLDRNATDRDGALFALPAPDPDNDGTTEYTVFARALGTPGGQSFTTTCAVDEYGDEYCSSITLKLERTTGKSSFTDVSKYLLYLYIDGVRYPLFANDFEEYFWRYDNDGLKLAQLRFYLTPTTVPDTAPYVVSIDPACAVPPQTNLAVTITGSAGTDFSGVQKKDVYIVGDGINLKNVSGTGTILNLTIDIASDATLEEKTIYVTYDINRATETINTTLLVGDTCE